MGKSGLEKLVQKSQKLNHNVTLHVPQIRRNPQQLHEASVALANRRTVDERDKSKAQYMFSRKGFDAEKLLQQLNRIELVDTFEPSEPLHETDLEGYLQHEHEILLLTAIEEAKKETLEQYNSDLGSYMEDEWEEAKREIVSYFGQKESVWGANARATPTGYPMQSERQITTGFGPRMDMNMDGVDRNMIEYARRVIDLNEHRVNGQAYPLALRFGEISSKDKKQQAVSTCWDLVQCIVGEGRENVDPPREGEWKERRKGAVAPAVLRQWLQGSISFLEKQYFSYMRSVALQKMDVAQTGSMPTSINTISGFVKAHLSSLSVWNDLEKTANTKEPIWALIYYSMRSGMFDAGRTFATDVPEFGRWYDAWTSRPFHETAPDAPTDITREYRRLSGRTKDPFKWIVYNIVGKCEPYRSHDDIPGFATEDYLWLKLNLIVVDNNPPGVTAALAAVSATSTASSDSFTGTAPPTTTPQLTLTEFQKHIVSFGPDHFNHPLLYFQILLASLQFESAIAYLESTGMHPFESLHIALTLHYYGVLNIPEDPFSAPLTGFERAAPFWNFVRHLTQYVRTYVQREVLTALNYLFVIQQDSVRALCLRDLLVETEEFSALLGHEQPNGLRVQGHLEKFVPATEWREIVSLAAASCEDSGKYEDAVLLFDAAGHFDKVVAIVTKQLARVLTGTGPERRQIIDLAASRFAKYNLDSFKERQGLRGDGVWIAALDSFRILLQMCDFFDAYHNSQFLDAIHMMDDIGLLPFNLQSISNCVAKFRNLTDPVRRNFAEILLATVSSFYRIYSAVKEERLNPEREEYIRGLKENAKAVVTFAGLINYRMPADTQSRLVRMEASMS